MGLIAVIILAALGALVYFFPEKCTKAEQRDDPAAVAQVKKLGVMLMGFAVAAGLMMLKYYLR